MIEQYKEQSREILQHVDTLEIDRAAALSQVLKRFDLAFRVVAREGAPYPDGNARVPKGEVLVTYDTDDVPAEVISRMIEKLVPIPKGIR